MSAEGQKQTSRFASFDHLVHTRGMTRRYVEAERLRAMAAIKRSQSTTCRFQEQIVGTVSSLIHTTRTLKPFADSAAVKSGCRPAGRPLVPSIRDTEAGIRPRL